MSWASVVGKDQSTQKYVSKYVSDEVLTLPQWWAVAELWTGSLMKNLG